MKLANMQNVDYSESKWPKASSATFTVALYHNIQTCLLVYIADHR